MRIMKPKNSMKFGRLLLAIAAPAVFGGCAMKGDIRTLQEEIRAIAARQDSLVAELRRETRLAGGGGLRRP